MKCVLMERERVKVGNNGHDVNAGGGTNRHGVDLT